MSRAADSRKDYVHGPRQGAIGSKAGAESFIDCTARWESARLRAVYIDVERVN